MRELQEIARIGHEFQHNKNALKRECERVTECQSDAILLEDLVWEYIRQTFSDLEAA